MQNALALYKGFLDQDQMRQIRAQQADQSLQQTANQTGLAQFGMLKDIVALKNQQEQMAAMRGALAGGGQPDLERVGQAMLASGDPRGVQLVSEARRAKAEQFSEANRNRQSGLMAQIEARKAAAAEAAAGNAPVQTHTDNEGRLWERKRGGKWELATSEGKQISSKMPPEKEFQDLDKARAQFNLEYPISMAGIRTRKGNKPVPDFGSYYRNEWPVTKQVAGIGESKPTTPVASKPASKLYSGKEPPAEYPDAKFDGNLNAWIVKKDGKSFAVSE